MHNNQNEWQKKKEKIKNALKDIVFHEGEIWFASLGLNVGKEQDGKGEDFLRPVVVLKKMSKDMCVCIPLTTKKKTGTWYCSIKDSGGKEATASLCQIRTLHINRLTYKIGKITKDEFINIKNALRGFLKI
ncbi:hypothetical protein COB57_00965 [Candidatus Peregrinibacteria bacterium]|nr:MAG: hypothetical protein COB57_00965 [Candidatus Peregrinibacteria bacterium]